MTTTASRLLVLSDLHIERGAFVPPNPELYDLVVLAGDISPGVKAVHWAWLQPAFAGKPVVLVPGNHEFYGSERTRALEFLREQARGSNVHLLDRDEVIVAGIRFLGATLWTDFALDVTTGTSVAEAMDDATLGLNDFSGRIRERRRYPPGERRFTPQHALREHLLSRAWLLDRLNSDCGDAARPTVVVTHHAPSPRSMDEIYKGNELNPCFYSDLPMEYFQRAALWVHGHTHSSADYLIGKTRVLANPRGYLSWSGTEENSSFKKDLIVTVLVEREANGASQ